MKTIMYLLAVLPLYLITIQCVTASCIKYGHTCYGAHGKRDVDAVNRLHRESAEAAADSGSPGADGHLVRSSPEDESPPSSLSQDHFDIWNEFVEGKDAPKVRSIQSNEYPSTGTLLINAYKELNYLIGNNGLNNGYDNTFNFSYMYTNPSFPKSLNESGENLLMIKKLSRDVRQIRMDFLIFELAPPDAMTKVCTTDVMIVKDGTSDELKICGPYNGRHVYYDINDGEEDFIIINITLSDKYYKRRWKINITQLHEYERTPAGCVQYFYRLRGTMSMTNITLNGWDLNSRPTNRICIRHMPNTCSIGYTGCNGTLAEQPFVKLVPVVDNLNGNSAENIKQIDWEEITDENTGICLNYRQIMCPEK